jgi:hypothetical protein
MDSHPDGGLARADACSAVHHLASPLALAPARALAALPSVGPLVSAPLRNSSSQHQLSDRVEIDLVATAPNETTDRMPGHIPRTEGRQPARAASSGVARQVCMFCMPE